jgi:hypothetical protein
VGEEVTVEIYAVTSTILRVLRAFDFFQQIKRDILSSQREKFRARCAELFYFNSSDSF